eukprot:m.490407 g.490407  ORF g.490407 m.490407 type:complete len:66 (-) comp57253_c0_seq7:97-294(-)
MFDARQARNNAKFEEVQKQVCAPDAPKCIKTRLEKLKSEVVVPLLFGETIAPPGILRRLETVISV